MKTPEEMAKDWILDNRVDMLPHPCKSAFLAGYQAAKELYAAKLKEANDTVAGMADECEGLKTIIYDYDETNLLTPAKWISVKDRLPEDHQYVLGVVFGDIEIGYINRLTTDPNEFSWEAGNNWIDKGHSALTHWMPLPTAPEGSKT